MYIAYMELHHGGPLPEPMTVEKGNALEKDIQRRMAKKARDDERAKEWLKQSKNS